MSVTFYRIGCIAMAELDIGAGLCSDPGRPAFKPKVSNRENPIIRSNGRIYRQYQRLLRFAIHYRWIWIVATVILLVFSVYGYRFIKQGFFPT